MKPAKPVKIYEDFQDSISDEMLIDGAYRMGVISWEAHKMLRIGTFFPAILKAVGRLSSKCFL